MSTFPVRRVDSAGGGMVIKPSLGKDLEALFFSPPFTAFSKPLVADNHESPTELGKE